MMIRMTRLTIAAAIVGLLTQQGSAQTIGLTTEKKGRAAPLKLESFQDCDVCPIMLVIPGGRFRMGSDDHAGDERPAHQVSVPRFALGLTEVTIGEWRACVEESGCDGSRLPDGLYSGPGLPVANVSWEDAQSYVRWLNRKLATPLYRLPSEAEWEFAARAGSTGWYWSGEHISKDEAKYGGARTLGGANALIGAVAAGSMPPNPWGLYEILGNVSEWTEDCWRPSYQYAPVDGSARRSGDCSSAPVRGGAWNDDAFYLRSANRHSETRDHRSDSVGFRVARSLADR